MTFTEIRKLYQAAPFRPFEISLTIDVPLTVALKEFRNRTAPRRRKR